MSPFDPGVLGALWRYRWLALAIVAVFGAFGYSIALLASGDRPWEATATMVVEDPRATALFEATGVQRPERYLENQVAILESEVVAQRASTVGEVADPPLVVTPEEIADALTIDALVSSDAISVSFQSADPASAVAGANAVAVAYQDVRRSEAAREYSSSIDELDRSIAESEAELEDLQAEVDVLLGGDLVRRELETQYAEAIARLVQLQDQRVLASGEALDAIRADLDDLLQQLQSLQLVIAVDEQDPELAVLLARQQAAVDRVSALTERRDQIAVDAELAGSGVLLFSPAVEAEPAELNATFAVAVALALGVIVAGGVAYGVARRRRTFTDRSEPEIVLGVPMLAEIPMFREERIKSDLPVTEHPFTAAAEGFRFLAAAAARYAGPRRRILEAAREQGGQRDIRSVAILSSLPGEGKSTVAANTALALAGEGNRVLAIDADFGDQRLSRLLGHPISLAFGLTEVIVGEADLAEAAVTVDLVENELLGLLARGEVGTPAAELLRSDGAAALFAEVRDAYDVVVVDTPPLLHVAYAGTLLGYVDAAIVVINHGSNVSVAEELADRLQLVDIPVLGYVYNKAPLRRSFRGSEGSMQDIVGSGRGRADRST